MKKFVKITALVLVIATFACLLASCGKTLSGTYVLKASDVDLGDIGSNKTTVKFSGNKMTVTSTREFMGQSSTTTQEGTYKIEKNDKDEWTITTTTTVDGKEQTSTVSFEEVDKDTIKIGGITYVKEK